MMRAPLKRASTIKRTVIQLCAATSVLTSLPLGMLPPAFAQNLPTLGDTSREDLSPQAERKMGEQIMGYVRRDPDFLDDAPISEYLNRMGNRLLDANPGTRGEAGYDFEFFAVRDPVLNAFAFPGGFIGFHSGLILAAQTESELASVMGHEIGHVAQRHIARAITGQKGDSLIPLAALALAVLASRSSPDAAIALAAGGQGLAIQKQINFTREAEREADRVGYQFMREAGYDPKEMVSFFGRLQTASRNYSDALPPFLRSHPLTHERMADIQSRVNSDKTRQHADSPEFALVKARVKVLQDSTVQGLLDANVFFDQWSKSEKVDEQIAAIYGHAFVALKQREFKQAQAFLDACVQRIESNFKVRSQLALSSLIPYLQVEIFLAQKQFDRAIAEAERANKTLPLSRGMAYLYVEVLLAANKVKEAEAFLEDQLTLYRSESKLQHLLAKVYAEQGKEALQHLALAEAYNMEGNIMGAMQQLDIAKRARDAGYYELARVDARERDWKDRHKEELEAERKNRR